MVIWLWLGCYVLCGFGRLVKFGWVQGVMLGSVIELFCYFGYVCKFCIQWQFKGGQEGVEFGVGFSCFGYWV